MQVKFANATELRNVDPNSVSLVKRGANRQPFRITKGDDDMIDLHKIGRLFKGDAFSPAVVAVICHKADAAMINLVSKAVGLTEFKKTADQGVVLLHKADVDFETLAVVKFDDDMAVGISNLSLKKAFSGYDWSATDFKDVVGTNGYCSSLSMATDMLQMTIGNILASAATSEDAIGKISKATSDYNDYVDVITKAIPQHAFKADREYHVAKAAKKVPNLGDGNGKASGGAGMNQSTGDGDNENGTGVTKAAAATDDADAKMTPEEKKAAFLANMKKAKKVDAGKNGTGAGVELGEGTGTTPSATSDDAANNAVDAKPGQRVSGDSSGMPTKAMAQAKKGDQAGPTPTGESAAGEGAAESTDEESKAAAARATADDKKVPKTQGTVGGDTLDHAGIPSQVLKDIDGGDDEDEIPIADVGKKGKGKTLPDDTSGAGAQGGKQGMGLPVKKDELGELAGVITALAKQVTGGMAVLTKSMTDLSGRVDSLDTAVKKNDAALNGTVLGEAESERVGRARKSDIGRSEGIAALDTAYNREHLQPERRRA